MRKCLIFCHGWGGTINFWNNLKNIFDLNLATNYLNISTFFLDLGYFGNPIDSIPFELLDDPELEFIGIGHSLGLIKLLNLNIKFKALIGLQSFINFLGIDLKLRVLRTKALNLLIKNFALDPLATLENFYRTIGFNNFRFNQQLQLDQFRLQKDLNLLSLEVQLKSNIPILIIGAKDDIIVPPALLLDNFSNYSSVEIKMLSDGGHGLGFKHPETIYNNITQFLYDIN